MNPFTTLKDLQNNHKENILRLAYQFMPEKEIDVDSMLRHLKGLSNKNNITEVLSEIRNSKKKNITKSVLAGPIELGGGSAFEVMTKLAAIIVSSSEASILSENYIK